MSVLEVHDVSIRYITGDFKDIGLKEYVMKRLKGEYRVTEFWADRNVTFTLEHGEMLGIIGTNGAGKSTLLKTLVGILKPLGGNYTFGHNVEWGYFDQQQAVKGDMDPEQTVLDNFWQTYPGLMREQVRSALGSFLFSQEEVEKKSGQLSGGEKVRLALCKMFQTRPNLRNLPMKNILMQKNARQQTVCSPAPTQRQNKRQMPIQRQTYQR